MRKKVIVAATVAMPARFRREHVMRRKSLAVVLIALVMGSVVAVPAAFAGRATSTTVTSEFEGVNGTSTVVRNGQGVSIRYSVENLTPGNVYTAWVTTELPPPGPPAALAGVVVGPRGTANFAGHIAEDGVIADSDADDVVIIIVNHGPNVPGAIRTSMTNAMFCSGPPCGPVIHAEHLVP